MSRHPNQELRILISGCGRIGSQLGLLLEARGHTVWGLRRQPERLPEKILPIRADLTSSDGLDSLPTSLDFVFHFSSARAQSNEAYTLGITNLIEAMKAQKQQIQRLYFVSSTGVFSQKDGDWVDEDSAAEPTHDAGRYLLEGETRVMSSIYPGTVVRFGGIYGQGRVRLLERISNGEEFCTQNLNQYTNLIHEEDCVAVLYHLMQMPKPEELYLAVDCQPVDRCFLVTWLARQLRVPEPRQLPADSLPARLLRSNKRCSNRRLLKSGYRFAFPTFQEGYGPLLRAWKNTGKER